VFVPLCISDYQHHPVCQAAETDLTARQKVETMRCETQCALLMTGLEQLHRLFESVIFDVDLEMLVAGLR
jgi:hypothetical protein